MTATLTTREARVRRAAGRHGWRLVKARVGPEHPLHGTYGLDDGDGRWVLADVERGYGCSLEAVEEHLARR